MPIAEAEKIGAEKIINTINNCNIAAAKNIFHKHLVSALDTHDNELLEKLAKVKERDIYKSWSL